MKLHAVAILVTALAQSALATTYYLTATYDVVDKKEAGVAYLASAKWNDRVMNDGWAYLTVTTNESISNVDQALAAGYIEGAVTHERMYQSAVNQGTLTLPDAKILQFLEENEKWMQEQVKSNPEDSYWNHVRLVFAQLDGLHAGYSTKAPSHHRMSRLQVLQMSLGGDYEDLETALGVGERMKHVSGSWIGDAGNGHCSALVKILPNFEDIYIAQTTWSSLNCMLRIYKKYDLRYRTVDSRAAQFMPQHLPALRTYAIDVVNTDVPATVSTDLVPSTVITFSSYPGSLFSGDDWYQLGVGMVSLETTIGNSNMTLYKDFVKPQTVLEWVRNMLANRLATSGESWTNLFSKHNSGTYNNEWLILDYRRFTPGVKPSAGAFWLLDQVPGFIHAEDLTEKFVRQGYWPSYNTAYFKNIFDISGGPEAVAQYGDWFTYDKTPRALIFKRNESLISSPEDMQAVMRYNNFEHDPLSRCNCSTGYSAENAIACRDDLNPASGTYPFSALGHRNHVATDAKMTSFRSMMGQGKDAFGQYPLGGWAISGPTYYQQPVFDWGSTSYSAVPHLGQPDRFDFPWVTLDWSTAEVNALA